MSKSAIPTDVPENTPAAPAAETQKSPRELAYEAIEARHHGDLAKENGYELADDGNAVLPAGSPAPATPSDAEGQLAAQLASEDDSSAPAPAAAPAAPPAPAASAPSLVKIKVDGEETDVPFEEVVRQYQKNASADRRLAEATRLLREAQEREAQLMLQTQQQQQAQAAAAAAAAATPTTPPPAAPSLAELGGKEFVKALFEGDEDNALVALEKVIAGRQPQQVTVTAPAQPTLDIDQITQAVTQRVQHSVTIQHVLEANKRDYPELYADPDIEELAAQKIARLRNDQGMDFSTALNTVSQDFASKFGWAAARAAQGRTEPATPPTVPTNSARAAKVAQKASIDNVTSINTKPVTADAQPEDASSVIAQMRAARGGG